MNPGVFNLNPTGGNIPTIGAPIGDFNGGTPVTDGKLCVDANAGAHHNAGLQYTADGRLCVTTTAAPRNWVAGLPVAQSGRLCCIVGGRADFFLRGVPIKDGKVVLQNLPAVVQARDTDIGEA